MLFKQQILKLLGPSPINYTPGGYLTTLLELLERAPKNSSVLAASSLYSLNKSSSKTSHHSLTQRHW